MRRLLHATTAAIIVAVACTDSVTDPASQARTTPSVAAALASDPGINQNDTWLSGSETEAETTFVHSDQSFADPATGQQTTDMTLAEPAYPVSYISGYGYDGQFRMTNAYDVSVGEETQTVQQVGDGTGDVDGSGVASTTPLDVEPISDLGDLTYAQIDPTGGDGSGGSTGCPNNEITCTLLPPRTAASNAAPATSHAGAAPIRTVTHPDATHLRIEEAAESTLTAPRGRGANGPFHRKLRFVRDFERRNGTWLIKHAMQELTVTSAAGTVVHRQHHTIDVLTYHANPVADSLRRLSRLATGATPVASRLITPNTGRRSIDVSRDDNPCISNDTPDACGSTGAPNNTGYQDPAAPDNTNDIGTTMSSIVRGSPFTVVLQHGFLSAPKTWERMDWWLTSDIGGISTIRPKLDWTQHYEDQAVQLGQILRDSSVPGKTVLVGHSNGGMTERYLAENPYLAPGVNLGGVVTVGTPHRGAPLARYGRDMNRMLGVGGIGALIICAFQNEGGCNRFLNAINSTLSNYYGAYASGPPVVAEMQPNDQYHANFNATSESFQRYGIESYGWTLWKFWSEYGGAYCYSDSPCGDYRQVKKTDRTYHHDVTCSIIGLFTSNWSQAGGCVADAVFLKAINNVYNRYTETGGGGTYIGDGIVPAWSQPYPNIPDADQYPIYDGPGHLSETSAPAVGHQLERVFLERFGMQRINNVF